MDALRPANEAHRSDTVAESSQCILCRLQHRGVVRESEVVVGAEIDHFAPVGELHDRALGGADDALAFQQARVLERTGIMLEPLTKFF